MDLAFTMPLPAGQEFEVMDLVSLRLGFLDAGSQGPPAVDEHLIDPDGLADLEKVYEIDLDEVFKIEFQDTYSTNFNRYMREKGPKRPTD